MGKGNTEHRKTLIQRVDHHEKILALIADLLDNQVDPELKMLAGAIQQNKDDIANIVEWIDMGVFGRLWFNIKEVFRGDATPESTDSDAS